MSSWQQATSELGDQFIQKYLNKSTIIFHHLLKNRFHVAMHLFSNRSHVMSEYGKNKKVAHKMQLSLLQTVMKTEQNSKQHNSSRGVKKTRETTALFTIVLCLLTAWTPRTSQRQLSVSLNKCPLHILTPSMINNCTEQGQHGTYLFYLIKKQKLLMVTSPMHFSSDGS